MSIFERFFFSFSRIDFYFKIFFYECLWSLWVFLKHFSFFESYIDFSSLIAWRSVHPLKSSSTYGTSQLFWLLRLFKSYEFFSKRLHFCSFVKALIDTLNLSISFVLIKFCLDPLTPSKVIVSTWKVHGRTCIQTDRHTSRQTDRRTYFFCSFCLLR